MDTKQDLRQALAEIARIAERASKQPHHDHAHDGDHVHAGDPAGRGGGGPDLGCVPRQLPSRLLVPAARTATQLNPANGVNVAAMASLGLGGDIMKPQRIAVLTSKYWGPRPRQLTVSFMDSEPADLRARIVSHLNAWNRHGGISFVETRGVGQVRISLGGGGYWSYLGTDILHIPAGQQTMNLEGFTMNTPDDEYRRVVRHEAGHTLGFPHEHMRRELVDRIDPQKAYDYFLRTQGWDPATVDAQVLTPLDAASIMGTPTDQDSCMCYQLPSSITRDGRAIRGGNDINASDGAFCARIYPKGRGAAGAARAVSDHDDHAHSEAIPLNVGRWETGDDPVIDVSSLH